MSKTDQNTNEPINKGGFWPFASAFFSGMVTKELTEDTIRANLKQTEKPVVGIGEFFKKQRWKDIGEATQKGGFWKAFGGELLIVLSSFIPGAALGYFVFKPKQQDETPNNELSGDRDELFSDQAKVPASERRIDASSTKLEGRVAETETHITR